jgi:polysaccharide biosynthesis/export protein
MPFANRTSLHALISGLLLSALLVLAAPGAAQDQAQQAAEQQVGRPVPQSEILEKLRTSGMSREQARDQLARSGYSAGLLDSYFDVLEGARPGQQAPQALPAPGSDFLAALQSLGITFSAPAEDPANGEQPEEVEQQRAIGAGLDGGVGVFGRSIFAGATSQFAPMAAGPVDQSYRLGPGDNLNLILTGDVELAYHMEVNREGAIVIPQVGQLFVNGLTLAGLRELLYERLGRVYSGVRRDGDAPTRFDVSLGRLRTNQVYLIGEASTPGAYQVPSVATVFNALYQAGGPSPRGTFRRLEVRRGGRTVQSVDLYRYLIAGDTRQDIRLEQGDIVFIPLAGRQVTVQGNVRRPAIFELTPGEGLREALSYAGGFARDAFVRRLQIDRIVPAADRVPGLDREIIDVSLEDLERGQITLEDGDVVSVFGISNERRNRVTIRGEVSRPGTYSLTAGTGVWDLVRRAEGLLPDAYRATAHVIRLNPVDGRYHLHRVALELGEDGAPLGDLALQEMDEVVVYGQAAMLPRQTVAILGEVLTPGTFPYADGMTLRDLVLAAGGTTPDMLPERAHVSRRRSDGERELLRLELTPDSIGVPREQIRLEPEDQVRIFSREIFLRASHVAIHGRVAEPGTFRLVEGMTLQDLVLAAGGFDKGALDYEVEVARLTSPHVRGDTLRVVHRVALGTDLQGLPLKGRGPSLSMESWRPDEAEFRLEDGDRVFVRRLPGWQDEGVVEVVGQILYGGEYPITNRGTRLTEVLKAAGGLTREAYVPGFRIIRDDIPVAVDLQAALRRPGGTNDIVLRGGDRLVIPSYDPTVLVTGAVPFQTRVLHRPGWSLDQYVRQAGGYADYAAEDRVSVTYPNGEREVVRQRLGMFRSTPKIEPGSVVHVPAKPQAAQDGFDWDRALTKLLAVASTLATVMIAADRLGR